VCVCVCVRRKSYDSALLRKKNKVIRMIRIKMKLSLKHHQSFLIVVDMCLSTSLYPKIEDTTASWKLKFLSNVKTSSSAF